jgi:hypothetical protein
MIPLLLSLALACGTTADVTDSGDSADSATADGCSGLCVSAGFDDGVETDFGGGVVECQCSGTGGGIAQDACAAYCADFGVAPETSYLSSEFATNDKCVCDGTGG